MPNHRVSELAVNHLSLRVSFVFARITA